ncbi:MAG: CAP family protein [Geitlerinemataceae cyanobacterium]
MTHFFVQGVAIAGTIVLGTTISIAATTPADPTQIAQNTMVEAILGAHNQYRAEVDVPPLAWSDALAGDAQEWADYLASLGGDELEHAENTGQGENLWMGTAGFFSYTEMVTSWGEEQQNFIGGTFPDVSATGNWSDVGHYTQMVWRETTQVGCGMATAGGNNILVCRYSPPGNFVGEFVY